MYADGVMQNQNVLTYDFQDKAIEALFYYYKFHKGHTLIVAPTGSGKTHILSKLIHKLLSNAPSTKVLVLTHTKEIIQQDYDTLTEYIDREKIGIYSAGIGLREIMQITIAGIQSVYKMSDVFYDVDYIIVDEAHLIPPKGMGMYRTFFERFSCPIVGLTATPFRRGHGYLTDNHIFDKIVYDIPVDELINQGYLCKLIAKHPGYEIDTKGLKVVAGDYLKSELSQRADKKTITKEIVEKLKVYKSLRKKWLVFCIDIQHAEHVAEELRLNGILADTVHSKLTEAREPIIRHFKNGDIQALVSVETLTTGFNVPDVDMIVLLRPTQSPVLHVQMIGRGLRIAPDKDDCLVLDFSGNVARLGPINDVHIAARNRKKKGNTGSPVRVCPDCQSILPISTAVCPDCGYKFPRQTKLTRNSSDADIVADKKKRQTLTMYPVNKVTYYAHTSIKSGVPCLKVIYRCGLKTFTDYIQIERKGYLRKLAEQWWNYRSNLELPDNAEDALAMTDFLRRPIAIGVINIKGRDSIVRYIWKQNAR